MKQKKVNWLVIITGIAVAVAALILTKLGNPKNMGFCIACFIRDIAGGTKLHSAGVVQYIRPEIIGIVLGSFIMALITKEFKPKSGSSPATRFVIGFFVMIGALVFLGCPLRMVLRLGGGDLNALVGLVGFILGILIGIFFLNKGFTLKRAYDAPKAEGLAMPVIVIILGVLVLAVPTIFVFSEKGPGSMHAPFAIALIIALIVGGLCQKSRLCMVGGLRDSFLFKDFNLLWGFVAILVVMVIGNIILGSFNLGFGNAEAMQPIAHKAYVWNLLGMTLVGWGSVLLGGCPLRQLILAGEGNGDSAVTVLGMLIGAAFAHNFGLAGAAMSVAEDGTYSAGGIKTAGIVALFLGFAVLLFISIINIIKHKQAAKAE